MPARLPDLTSAAGRSHEPPTAITLAVLIVVLAGINLYLIPKGLGLNQ
jgi:hypothetical protein